MTGIGKSVYKAKSGVIWGQVPFLISLLVRFWSQGTPIQSNQIKPYTNIRLTSSLRLSLKIIYYQ